ncbi:flavin-containing monooxygenase [Yoonia sediminilitoris]|uniref:Cation diffusion facilitator CzcD-associated flavoprotein CzcO n=1 Tax=Yoonia sediminilitoris TaxID=1286148 RepID=A0A2T6K6S8_9RHOB|nr:NAD(P)/FAD-dependent oxidoreductase [Yoonia sediminilitoris]PUB10398.1 cation diffusion facilitator CzcD-associated flavoprotein CzcO [Yoonia sediminilitoris]RCW89864.1 cation diffusion facilitator CzcD-associated flavoprotein CzcO [Yoonia sediminilitoris]
MEYPNMNDTIVIGAGLSGLAAARALRDRNIPVTILEASDRVADPWRKRHPQLRLNIHRHFAQLPGAPMTRNDGTYVRRDTVVGYLEDYAKALDAEIRFGTRVLSVERHGDGWHVQTNKGELSCAHLVVATGRESIPTIPIWPGMERYGRPVIHTADFGDVTQYEGRKVLVVGAGNSGTDVLSHLARINPAKVWVSVRHGPSILPKLILGFPLHRLAKLFTYLPKWSLDPSFVALQWLSFGNLRRFGLRRHRTGGATRMRQEGVTFALDDGFVAALKTGRFEAVPETVGFDDTRVELANGRRIDPDVVICATGYETGLKPLFRDLGALDHNGRPLHPMGQPDPDNPGLWFTGFTPGLAGFFHAAGETADKIAKAITNDRQPAESAHSAMPQNLAGTRNSLGARLINSTRLTATARRTATKGASQ